MSRDRWFWWLTAAGYTLGFVLLTYASILDGLLDLKQAITLAIVEVPIAVLVSFLAPTLFAEQRRAVERRQAEEAKKKEREQAEAENHLKGHFENEILPVLDNWFGETRRSPATYPPPLSSSIGPAVAIFVPNKKSIIHELAEPQHFDSKVVSDVEEHLSKEYPDRWNAWLSLKAEANSNLRAEVREWENIEANISTKAKALGLIPWDGTGERPPDFYTISRLVEAVWNDPEYLAKQKKHVWDEYNIERESITEKRDNDVVRVDVWSFGGTWVSSKKRDTLDKLKIELVAESEGITENRNSLARKHAELGVTLSEFDQFLKGISKDNARHYKRFSSTCATCEEWAEKLRS